MNVIARQSFKYSLVGYFGFILGSLSAIFVFPLDMDFYGKLRYILSAAEIVLPFVVFGLSYACQKFFLHAEKAGKQQNLLTLVLIVVVFNFCLFTILYFLVNRLFPQLKTWNFFRDFWNLKYIIIPLILILALSQVYNRYLTNYKRIVIPNIFENVFPKIANLGAFFLFLFVGWPEKYSLFFFVIMAALGLIGYHFYLGKLEKFRPDFSLRYIKTDHLWRKVLDYGFFGLLGNVGNYLSFRISGYMIPGYLSFQDNGVYGIILAICSVLAIPQLGLLNIAAPIINKQLENNEMRHLNRFHKKTSLALYFLGLVLFSCVIVGYPYLTRLIKNGDLLLAVEPVLWITGVGLMFDLATGFNSQIISMSKFYRVNILITLFLAVLNISLNFYFLKYTEWGLIGVAFATSLSLVLYNIIKIWFNLVKFKVHPFSWQMLIGTILCAVAVTAAIMFPDFQSAWINLIVKPTVTLIIIVLGNYFLKVIPMHGMMNKGFFKNLIKF